MENGTDVAEIHALAVRAKKLHDAYRDVQIRVAYRAAEYVKALDDGGDPHAELDALRQSVAEAHAARQAWSVAGDEAAARVRQYSATWAEQR